MSDAIFFGLFGLIVGSFLNVLILRWGERPLTGRSVCRTCGRILSWYELVPVVSWILQLGRCRGCRGWISFQYPLVEVGTGVLFALIGSSPLPFPAMVFALPIAALLITITVYDLQHTLIPDAWVYLLCILALVSMFFFSPYPILHTPYLLLAGPFVASPLFGLWFFSRGAWMGFGDVKLALAIGWLLGGEGGLTALFLAFIIGGAFGAALLFFSSSLWRRSSARFTPSAQSQRAALTYTMKSEVPFGPFLVVATLIVWISYMYGLPSGLELLGGLPL
ncbi:prepilin peptidase [Candidatus Kaiserbacteria bacterium]|nr:prepilin peptidase [Candidatus Kaiserbacteria bacterium]